jgi:hypothetical protein
MFVRGTRSVFQTLRRRLMRSHVDLSVKLTILIVVDVRVRDPKLVEYFLVL